MAAAGIKREQTSTWRKFAFAFLILAYFLYFNWDGLWAHFAADDMMNMAMYWRLPSTTLLLDVLLPWRGAYRPAAAFFYLPLLRGFGLNPVPYHAAMLAILLGNLYLVYRFALRLGSTELQAALATLIVAYHAGLSTLYYSTAFIYDVLCFSFYIGAFLLYARIRAAGRLSRNWETLLVMALYLCALNAKEMALTLPIVLLAYEFIYHPPAAWSPKTLAKWLAGPGRVTLYCAALNLLYLYGKLYGPDALLRTTGYQAKISLHRLFLFERAAMGDLFLTWGSFTWRGVVAVWLLLAYLAWRRPRPTLRYCWIFLVFTPLPLAVLEGRSGACLYIPLAGWAVFAVMVLTDTARAAAHFLAGEPLFRRAGFMPLFTAIVFAAMLFWAKENAWRKHTFVRDAMADVGRQTAIVLDQMRALNPHAQSGAHVAFMHDPFQDWDMLFIAELWFRDQSLQFHLLNKTPMPPEELAKMTVFDFQDGRIVQITNAGSPRP